MIALMAVLLAMQPGQGESLSTVEEHVDLGAPIRGSDYRLIRKAAGRSEMENADLSCYDIYVYNRQGTRRVAFVPAKSRRTERITEEAWEITYRPPDPKCPPLEFVMGSGGRVVRVIRSRY